VKHIKRARSYSIAGSIGLSVMASLAGCGDQGQPPQGGQGTDNLQGQQEGQSFFMVIEKTGTAPDTYKVVEKHPTTGPTRAILRETDGTERFMSEEELRQLAEEEAAKVDAGTSRLTQEEGMSSGGLSLGETILAAAAGSLVGGMLANKLAGNRNFQRNQQRYGAGRPTSTISQPRSPSSSSTKSPRSGFFGGSRGTSTSSRGATSSYGG
jgi:hypothetical protein